MSDSDSRPSVRLLVIALPYPLCTRRFASDAIRYYSTRPGAFAAGSSAPESLPLRGERRAYQVHGKPLYEHALLFDTGGPVSPSLNDDSVLPSSQLTLSATTVLVISVLNHTACSLAVYASQWRLPDTMQHSLPAGG